MAIVKSTFNAVQTAGNILNGSMYHSFRTGVPKQEYGTTALSTYHAYRSFVWFDSSAITSALANERVISCAITMTSAGNTEESPEAVPVRLYRTNLLYDESKTGWTNANTLRPDTGMTYANPYNDHFIEYAETDNLAKGGTLTESVFVNGEQAQRLANALSSGYALGTWALKSGTSMMPSDGAYRCRHLTNVAITITHEPESLDVTSPTEANLSDVACTVGGSVTMSWSGATMPSSGNNITGYTIQASDKAVGSSTWSAYADLKTVQTTEKFGSTSVNSANAGYDRKFRIRTNGTISNSAWFELGTTLTTIDTPVAPTVTYLLDGTVCKFSINVSAGSYTTSQFIFCNGECIGMLGTAGGVYTYNVTVNVGTNSFAFTVRDDYGGVSSATNVTVNATRKNYGNNWCSFRGIRSEDVGCYVQTFMYVTLPAERLTQEKVIGMAGDIHTDEGKNIYEAYDAKFMLIADDNADTSMISEWLTGEGELQFGDDPRIIYDARIVNIIKSKRKQSRHSNLLFTIQAHIQPFKRFSDEDEILVAHSGSNVYNGGSVPCQPVITIIGDGDATVTIAGKTIKVLCVEGSAIVDVKNKCVSHSDGKLYANVVGQFPVIPCGMIPVEYSGCSSVYVKRNQKWR